MEVRIKIIAGEHDHYLLGWQDIGKIGSGTGIASDNTDCVCLKFDEGNTQWEAITANAGSTTTVGPFGTPANWEVIRLEFTCSATAGSRKVEVYLNGSLQGTMATDANMPTAKLMPTVAVTGDGSSPDINTQVDYAIFTFSGRPLAA